MTDYLLKSTRGFGTYASYTDLHSFLANQRPIESLLTGFIYRHHPAPVWIDALSVDGLYNDWAEVRNADVMGFHIEEELSLYPEKPSLDYLKRIALLQYAFNRSIVRLYDVSVHTSISLMIDLVIPVGAFQYNSLDKNWLLNKQGTYFFLTGVRKVTSLILPRLVERYLDYTKEDSPIRNLLLNMFYQESDKTFEEDLLRQKEYISSISRCLVDVSKLYPDYRTVKGNPFKDLMDHHVSVIKGQSYE